MANYPTNGILLTSKVTPESEYEDDYSQPGIQHSRLFRSQVYFRFELTHSLTLAEFNSLTAVYDAGARDTYTLTYHTESPLVTYSVIFTSRPEISDNLGNNKFKVSASLRGTKD